MTFHVHPTLAPADRRPRSVDSLLAPALNRGGHDADNFALDTAIMLDGRGSLASPLDVLFLEGCPPAFIEPDNFAPGGRVVSITEADLARWQAIRAAFAASRDHAPIATIITASN